MVFEGASDMQGAVASALAVPGGTARPAPGCATTLNRSSIGIGPTALMARRRPPSASRRSLGQWVKLSEPWSPRITRSVLRSFRLGRSSHRRQPREQGCCTRSCRPTAAALELNESQLNNCALLYRRCPRSHCANLSQIPTCCLRLHASECSGGATGTHSGSAGAGAIPLPL